MKNLPQYHSSHQQEAESLKSLESLIPGSQFIIRKEDGGDYGVDRILEVVKDGAVTNVRSHIQVKSGKVEFTGKGTIRRRVPIKTIVYLLRSPNSLFIVYSVEEKKFYWAWVRDVALEANKKGIDLEEGDQESFTYEFHRLLSEVELTEIHEKLLRDNDIVRLLDFGKHPFLSGHLEPRDSTPSNELFLLYLEGRYEAVVGLASASDLEKPFGRNLVAHSYYELRNLQQAYRVITQTNTTAPIDFEGRRVLAMVLCEMGRDLGDKEVVIRARATLDSIPREKWAWTDHYNYGNMLQLLELPGEASEHFKRAIAFKNDVAMVWKNLAGCHYALGEYEQDLECLDQALELDPDLVEALVSKANVLAEHRGEMEEAIRLLKRAVGSSDRPHYDSSDVHWWLAKWQAESGQIDEAVRSVDEALGQYPTARRLLQLRSLLVISNWRHSEEFAEEAIRLLTHIVDSSPRQFGPLSALIKIHGEQGRIEEGRSYLCRLFDELGFSCGDRVIEGYDLSDFVSVVEHMDAYLKYRSAHSLAGDFFELYDIKTEIVEEIELNFAFHFARLASVVVPGRGGAEILDEVECWVSGFQEMNRVASRLIVEQASLDSVEERSDLVALLVCSLWELTLRELSRQMGWLFVKNGYKARDRDAVLELDVVGLWPQDSVEAILNGAHDVIGWAENSKVDSGKELED